MSYQPYVDPFSTDFARNKALGADRAVFGSLVTAGRISQLFAQFDEGVNNNDVSTSTAGGGSVTQGSGHLTISSGSAATASASVFTNRALRYSPGREIYVEFTASFTEPDSSSTFQRAGLLDTDNGIFIGFEGTSFGITYRSGGSDTHVPRASWTEDKLTGLPESDFKRRGKPEPIDLTKSNVWRIRFGWLGSAIVILEVMSPDGSWTVVHVERVPNTTVTPLIQSPNLPVRFELGKTGATSLDLVVTTGSWDAGTVEDATGLGPEDVKGRKYITANVGNTALSTTVYTVSPGRVLRVSQLTLTVLNTINVTGLINIRDGGLLGPVLFPVTLAPQVGTAPSHVSVSVTLPTPLQFSTNVFLEMSLGLLTASLVVTGYEADG